MKIGRLFTDLKLGDVLCIGDDIEIHCVQKRGAARVFRVQIRAPVDIRIDHIKARKAELHGEKFP